jgi:hypothetical protein
MDIMIRIEHFFKGKKEFLFTNSSISILVDGFDSLERLLDSYSLINVEGAEEIIEE